MAALQKDIGPKVENTIFRPEDQNVVFFGEGVTVKGEISAPDVIIVDGNVEGTLTARSIVVGPSGVVKGSVIVTNAEVYGLIGEKLEVKQLLLVRSTGRVDGSVSYGEMELEKGAVISGGFTSNDFRSEKKPMDYPQSKTAKLPGSSKRSTPEQGAVIERQQIPLAEVELVLD